MRTKIKNIFLLFAIALLAITLVACNSDNDDTGSSKEEPDNTETPATPETPQDEDEGEDEEEVTVTVFFPWGVDLFNERVGPMADRLENINVEFLDHGEGSTEGLPGAIEEYAAAGIVPDIIVMGGNDLTDNYIEAIIEPLDDLVDKHEFDLSVINKDIIDTIRATGDNGELLSIPNSNDSNILYYNKDIFDKFGVEYPEDGMTWEEAIELSGRVSGELDGVNYRGLDIRGAERYPLEQRGVNLTDPETGEVLLAQEPAVMMWLGLAEDIYNAAGNAVPEDSDALGDFMSGTLAMALSSPQFMRWGIPEDRIEHVDFASGPIWSDMDGETAPAMSHYHWVINKYSENKDAAFKVLMEYVSEETQLQLTRGGQEMTILAEDDIKLQFGADLDRYDGKNVGAIFANSPTAPPESKSKYDKYVKLSLFDYIQGDADANTFLREAAEQTAIDIEAAENQ